MTEITEVDEYPTMRSEPAPSTTNTEELYKTELMKWLQKAIGYFFFFLILQTAYIYAFSSSYSTIPLFILDIKIIVFACFYRTKSLTRVVISADLVHQYCSIAIKSMVLLYIHLQDLRAVFILIPLIITSVCDCLQRVPKNQNCRYLTWLILVICKCIFLFTVLNITLKLDKIVNWPWSEVLWPMFFGLCCCLILTIGLLLFSIASFLSWVSSEITTNELIATFWLLFSLTGISALIFTFCIHISDSTILKLSNNYCIFPLIYLSLFIISTYFNLSKIISWWSIFFTSTEDLQPIVAQPRERATFASRLSTAIKKTPHVLMRISSSYFQPAETPKSKAKKRTFSLKTKEIEGDLSHRRVVSGPIKGQASQKGKICDMCCDRFSDAVIMDCGHGGICYECCIEMWKNVGVCHMCRAEIAQVLQVQAYEEQMVKVSSATRAVFEDEV